jgi:predicted enzyme related to lactoylglutathione lyase
MTRGAKAAIPFYVDVIGWNTEKFPGPFDYTMFVGAEGPVGGVVDMTGEAGTEQVPCHWVGFIGVDDLAASTARALALGAQVSHGPTTVPTVGSMTFLRDPQGASFAMFQPETPSGDERVGNAPMGNVAWHELSTTDPLAAWDFYSTLFGWVVTGEMEMGPGQKYRMFGTSTLPQKPVGGFSTLAFPGMPPAWAYYWRVPSTPKAIEAAKARGATLIMGPMVVPGDDVIAVLQDPQGAVFCVVADKSGGV